MMEKTMKLTDFTLEALKNAGADHASCIVKLSNELEVSAEVMELTQLRDIAEKIEISLQAFVGKKMASVKVGSSDEDEIKYAAVSCVEIAKASKDDDGHGMNDSGKEVVLENTSPALDTDKLLAYTTKFLDDVAKDYKPISLRRVTVSHMDIFEVYKNTFGTTIVAPSAYYDFSSMFIAVEKNLMSSMSGTGFYFTDFDRPFIEVGMVREMLENSTKHIHTMPFGDKAKGTVIMAPDCLANMLEYIMTQFMSPQALVAKTSRWQNMLGKDVAHPSFSLASEPRSTQIVGASKFTEEGFVTENQQIISDGKLSSLMPNLYASRKTGLERAKNYGTYFISKGGDKSLQELIGSIENGLLMYRYSGGVPTSSGDFSGIAKNSFIIKDGKITSGAGQTVVSGNLADMLMNIAGMTKEVSSNGRTSLPYMAFDGITIS